MTMPTPTPVSGKMTPERAAEIIQAAMEAQGLATPTVPGVSPGAVPGSAVPLGGGLNLGGLGGQQQGGAQGNASPTATVDAILGGVGGPGSRTTPVGGEDTSGDPYIDSLIAAGYSVSISPSGDLLAFLPAGPGNYPPSDTIRIPGYADDPSGTGTSATAIARLGLDRAKFAETEEQNLLANIMDALDIVRGSEAQQFQDIASVGPSLAGGREFFGGFGPEGGFTRLAELQGADVGPLSTEGNIMPITPAQTDPRIAQLLDALFGQFAG